MNKITDSYPGLEADELASGVEEWHLDIVRHSAVHSFDTGRFMALDPVVALDRVDGVLRAQYQLYFAEMQVDKQEVIAVAEVRVHEDWWQAVKERWLPGWVKRSWPVRMRTVRKEERVEFNLSYAFDVGRHPPRGGSTVRIVTRRDVAFRAPAETAGKVST